MTLLLVAFGGGAVGALVATSKRAQGVARFVVGTTVLGLAVYGLVILSGRL